MAGQVCGLLSAVCINLGQLAAAIEHFTAHRLPHTALRAITNPTG